MSIENLTEVEEKSLIGILYNHLSFGTTMEVSGEIKDQGIERLETLRTTFKKLLDKYNLTSVIDEQTYLLLGMTESISYDQLNKYISNEDNKHLQNRAKYFTNKSKLPAQKDK